MLCFQWNYDSRHECRVSRCDDVTYENIALRPAGPAIPQRAGSVYRFSRWVEQRRNHGKHGKREMTYHVDVVWVLLKQFDDVWWCLMYRCSCWFQICWVSLILLIVPGMMILGVSRFCLNILEMDVWLKVDEFSRSSPGTFPPQSPPAPFSPQIGAVSWRPHCSNWMQLGCQSLLVL